MPHDEQGQNLVRTHQFLDSSGNKLTIKFREPTVIKVECDKYLYQGRIYRARLTLQKRVELLDTSEPFYPSRFGLVLEGDTEPIRKRATYTGVMEDMVAAVNGFLVDQPETIMDIHKWRIATELRDINLALSRYRRQESEARDAADQLSKQLSALMDKYPEADQWYDYLDKSR